jgi:hypothetical protein
MKKLFLILIFLLSIFLLSGCSDPVITERGHNADWNEGYDQAMIDVQEKQEKCVNSLRGEIRNLKLTMLSTKRALSVATEPGFGYYPPYDDLLEALVGANDVLRDEPDFGIIYYTDCD